MKQGSLINTPEEHAQLEPAERRSIDSSAAPFRLQPDTELDKSTSYALADLLSYHDQTFVRNAYNAIAKRSPSPSELIEALDELRSGRRSKTEIVEQLCAKNPTVRVDGLGSAAFRSITRWPVIGYLLTVLRAISRLPVLVQHQQQFEAYIVGQQQRMADHINDLPVVKRSELSPGQGSLAEEVSDAIKTAMMLSDSLLELSVDVADGETRLQTLQTQHEALATDFRNSIAAIHEQLSTSTQELQTQLTSSAQQIQKQHEQSETRLHSDLVSLTSQLTLQQEQLEEARRSAETAAITQREFLIDEQRVIVEAQRAAISDLEEKFAQSSREQAAKIEQLTDELRDLRATIKKLQEAGLRQ